MPTIAQIRAARALLDWSQADLADKAGLSQTGIARIENGTNKPNSQTLNKIQAAFESAEIEFLDESGVRKKSGEIKTFRGMEGFRTFMDDVYETAKRLGGEICIFNGKPADFIKHLGAEWYEMHSQRMNAIKSNFIFKIIIREGQKDFIAGGFAEYRWFPDSASKQKTFYAYGDRLAFIAFEEDDVTIQVMTQADLADGFRVLFDIGWDNVAIKPNS